MLLLLFRCLLLLVRVLLLCQDTDAVVQVYVIIGQDAVAVVQVSVIVGQDTVGCCFVQASASTIVRMMLLLFRPLQVNVMMLLLLFRLMLLLFRMLWRLPVKRMASLFSKSSPGVSRVRPDQRSVYHNANPCTYATMLTKDDIPRPIQ